MRVALDWDSEELKEMHLPAVRERQPANENQQRIQSFIDTDAASDQYELWTSSSHGHGGEDEPDGYHYVEYGGAANLGESYQLRAAYGDDRLRQTLDKKRQAWGSPFVGVLYHLKGIKPSESKPYATSRRAQLLRREGFDSDEQTKDENGRIDYPTLIELLADDDDFASRAALFRRVQERDSVTIGTEARKRGYDIAKGRRDPTPEEAAALRDYARSRSLGHYGDGAAGVPEGIADRPQRLTFHEYFEMPEFELDTQSFGQDDDESEWYPANVRTGRYATGDDPVDEMTIKQVHDRIASDAVDILSPGAYDDDGDYHGVDLERWDRAISLERNRPLDRDEMAYYRREWHENQIGTPEETVRKKIDRSGLGDPFGDDSIHWEIIVLDGEDALKSSGELRPWWVARGVLDGSDPDARRNPIRNSTIVCDTEGFL